MNPYVCKMCKRTALADINWEDERLKLCCSHFNSYFSPFPVCVECCPHHAQLHIQNGRVKPCGRNSGRTKMNTCQFCNQLMTHTSYGKFPMEELESCCITTGLVSCVLCCPDHWEYWIRKGKTKPLFQRFIDEVLDGKN